LLTITDIISFLKQLNVAIAMHCNLRLPDAAPVLIRFNYDARSSLKSLNVSAAVL